MTPPPTHGEIPRIRPSRPRPQGEPDGTGHLVEIKSREDLERWLESRPHKDSVVITARAALRVAPLLVTALDKNAEAGRATIVLPVFRALAARWVAVGEPTQVAEFWEAAARADSDAHYAAADASSADAFAAADAAVCRAGASTAAELTAQRMPALLIPYPHAAGGHQEANARVLETAGAARVLLERDLTEERAASELAALLAEDAEHVNSAYEGLGLPPAGKSAELLADVVEQAGKRYLNRR